MLLLVLLWVGHTSVMVVAFDTADARYTQRLCHAYECDPVAALGATNGVESVRRDAVLIKQRGAAIGVASGPQAVDEAKNQ